MHAHGLLHGDLASKNVLLTKYSSSGNSTATATATAGSHEAERTRIHMAQKNGITGWNERVENENQGEWEEVKEGAGLADRVLKAGEVLRAAASARDQKDEQQQPGRLFAKVADFGLSRMMPAGVSHMSTLSCGTVTHQAPELLQVSLNTVSLVTT